MLKKPSLGLGTKLGSGIASNKSDLNVSRKSLKRSSANNTLKSLSRFVLPSRQSYLKSLGKKQKEVQKKYHRSGSVTDLDAGGGGGDNATEDDSDLASLAKEFAKEEIQVECIYISIIHLKYTSV